ncbi:minor capsid protein [Clostridium botulinum]|nr:minor capsid protein [Clostridium botulinum]
MNNIEYWKKREEAKVNKQFKKADALEKELKEQYEVALEEINKKIIYFYEKYAKDNDMTYKEATMFLTCKEYSRWRKTLEVYIRDIEYSEDELLQLELNTLAMKSRIRRLDNLKTDISVELSKLYKNQLEKTTELLSNITKDTYYETVYKIQVFKGIGHEFGKLDKNTINSILEYPWSGENYSNRIWKQKDKLANTLKQELTQKFIQGKDVRSTAKTIADKMNVSYKNACTLVQTESAYISSEATARGYEATGVEQYQILATLDIRTSSICREQDGKVYDLKDKTIGVNYPPFHIRCRTTTIPYFNDEKSGRAVRNPVTGKTYYVPSDINYKDWYKKYVENNPKVLAEEKKIQNKSSDKKQHERYREILGKDIPKFFDKFQELKYNNIDEWDRLAYKYKLETIYNLDRLKNTENFSSIDAIKHILEGEVNRNNPKRIKAVGFHMENMPTKKGEIIESTRSQIDKNGVYEAKVIINGITKLAKSTFFPTSMTPQQVVNAINEAYLSKKNIKGVKYSGTTSYGFDINMYLDRNKKITTAYPIRK